MDGIMKFILAIGVILFFIIMTPILMVEGLLSWGAHGLFSATPVAEVLPPPAFVPTYIRAGEKYHVPWWFLATINKIETSYNSGGMVSSAGAVGPMQFMPTTWPRYGQNVMHLTSEPPNGSPFDFEDAVFASAKMFHDLGLPPHPNTQQIAKFAGAYNAGLENWDNMSQQTVNYRAMAVQYSQEIKNDVMVPNADKKYWNTLQLSVISQIAESKSPLYGKSSKHSKHVKLPKIIYLTNQFKKKPSINIHTGLKNA